jgi:hypothetical protein
MLHDFRASSALWGAKTLTVILECIGLQAKPNFRHPQVAAAAAIGAVLLVSVAIRRRIQQGELEDRDCASPPQKYDVVRQRESVRGGEGGAERTQPCRNLR